MDTHYYQSLCNAIHDITTEHPKSAVYCAEDLNLPDIHWNSESVSSYRYPMEINTSTLDLIADCGLVQIVDFPT